LQLSEPQKKLLAAFGFNLGWRECGKQERGLGPFFVSIIYKLFWTNWKIVYDSISNSLCSEG
jgi:hypothetical protein